MIGLFHGIDVLLGAVIREAALSRLVSTPLAYGTGTGHRNGPGKGS